MSFTQRLALGYLRTNLRLLSFFSKQKAAEKALKLFRTPRDRVLRKPTKLYAEAEKLQVISGDVKLRGFRWNKGAGKRVMIVHGFESSVVNFEHYVQPLIDKGYEVLAFDAPGHGVSEGKLISAPAFASMVVDVNEKYGPIHSFITHSFGGLAVALAIENIRHDETYKIVFMAPATESTTAVDQFFSLLKLNGDIRKIFEQLIIQIGKHPVEWFSIRRAMKNIRANVLWIHDEGDKQTPLSDALKVKQDNYPNIHFIVTKDIGHSRLYRDPEIAKKAIDFL